MMQPEVDSFLETCGGFRAAIHRTVSFSRACSLLLFAEPSPRDGKKRDPYRTVSLAQFYAAIKSVTDMAEATGVYGPVLQRVLALKLAWEQEELLTLRLSVVDPLYLVRLVLRSARPDHELRYAVMRDIREHYKCVQSSAVAHSFQTLSTALNELVAERHAEPGKKASEVTWSIRDSVIPVLSTQMYQGSFLRPQVLDLFLECCRTVNYISLSTKIGFVEFVSARMDAEYLLSRLFGLPTAIKGLDDLFGGGGIMLVDAADTPVRERIGGRAVVTVGQFGSAKSLLSLQIAVEVARKGGLAWVMPLEQTAEDCLYTLESMGCLRSDVPFRVATTVSGALEILENRSAEEGGLILLRTVKENFEDFVVAFNDNVVLMKQYPLRLIVVDPISALAQTAEAPTEKRARILQLFEEVKQSGVNIWLITEEGMSSSGAFYEQYTADTVIRLSSDNRHGYSQRYLEITKSRLQREQRGKHAFAIVPGVGMNVYPSPAAVRSRMKMRSERAPSLPIRFGLDSLDQILGERGIYAGDLIVLQGADECSKSPMGMSFLLGSDWNKDSKGQEDYRPLLISARDEKASIRHSLEQVIHAHQRQMSPSSGRRLEDICMLSITGGYVKPGFVLQEIEDEFLQSRLNQRPIGRVMIDNIGHWELSCPYIREDETFADTLVDLLRGHRVTTVITCDEASRQFDSTLQRSVLDRADCLIQFEKILFRGTTRVILRVVKTRDMTHRRESFELVSDPNTLQVKTASSLLQIGTENKVSPVEVRLFLHAESHAQTAYNKAILKAVRSILTRQAHLESQTFVHSSQMLSLGSASAIDELQILQLDEYQLPLAPSGNNLAEEVLHVFPEADWTDDLWEGTIERLRDRVHVNDGYLAVPFYANIGLLAFRKELSQKCRQSWEELSLECMRWEREHRDPKEIFFDFAMVSSENYSVLFFEILLWLAGPPNAVADESPACLLKRWLTSEESVQATRIMHRLCRRAFNLRHEEGSQDLDQPTPFRVSPDALVWRHWYSTLNQMFAELLPTERAQIQVTSLPGGHSVAGEWFLAIPRYSAATDVGRTIIQLYTSREAELDRLKYGVGLPVRRSFYGKDRDTLTDVSPFLAMEAQTVLRIIEGSFRRSSFGCYRTYSSMLASHLQGVLALLTEDDRQLETEIRRLGSQFNNRLGFGESSTCALCFAKGGKRPTERPIPVPVD